MHPIDRAASLLFRHGPESLKVFQGGWGDDDLISALFVDDGVPEPAPIRIRWAEPALRAGRVVTDGTFPSPAEHLPAASRTARVRRVAPADPGRRLVVLMAAWNDHGYRTRMGLATRLADRGYTAVMLENPYYGERRPWDDPPIRTVADFAVMGRAAADEGRSLLHHFAAGHDVGVTGYSMGGNIACLVGALMDEPVAIAGLAASHSPSPVWLDGILNDMVDWAALGGPDQSDRLRQTLRHASVLAVPARPHTATAVIAAGRNDGYIPATAVEALHDHWPGSTLRWIDAGHATMIWRHKDELVDAIVEAYDRTYGGPESSQGRSDRSQ